MEVWVLIILGSLLLGLWSWRATIAVGPLAAIGFGALVVANERPTYDMPGVGYAVGGVVAVLALIAWLIGRLMRHLLAKRQA